MAKNIYSGGGELFYRKLKEDGTYDLPIKFSRTSTLSLDVSKESKDVMSTEGCEQSLIAKIDSKTEVILKIESEEVSIDMFNIAFDGELASTTQASATAEELTVDGALVKVGYIVDVGKFNTSNMLVQNEDASVTYVEDTDYTFCSKTGYIEILDGGIVDGTTLKLTYDVPEAIIKSVEAFAGKATNGEFIFNTNSQTGENYRWTFYKLHLVIDGGFEVKGEDIGKLTMSGTALKAGATGTLADYFKVEKIPSTECC